MLIGTALPSACVGEGMDPIHRTLMNVQAVYLQEGQPGVRDRHRFLREIGGRSK
jgi:hypothetical protein